MEISDGIHFDFLEKELKREEVVILYGTLSLDKKKWFKLLYEYFKCQVLFLIKPYSVLNQVQFSIGIGEDFLEIEEVLNL